MCSYRRRRGKRRKAIAPEGSRALADGKVVEVALVATIDLCLLDPHAFGAVQGSKDFGM